MAAYVPVPRDLSKVKTKLFLNLTRRQLICFSIAAAVGIPSFLAIRHVSNASLACMCMIFIMMPMFLLAMYEKDGQPLEVIARHYIESRFLRPKVRIYQTNNDYAALMRMNRAEEEVREIVNEAEKRKSGKEENVERTGRKEHKNGRRRPSGLSEQKRKKAGRRDHPPRSKR